MQGRLQKDQGDHKAVMVTKRTGRQERTFDVRRDMPDFPDMRFISTLAEVPTHIPASEHRKYKTPVLDQGSEGACTGFSLAAVANLTFSLENVSFAE